jgi:hypothetical protein
LAVSNAYRYFFGWDSNAGDWTLYKTTREP